MRPGWDNGIRDFLGHSKNSLELDLNRLHSDRVQDRPLLAGMFQSCRGCPNCGTTGSDHRSPGMVRLMDRTPSGTSTRSPNPPGHRISTAASFRDPPRSNWLES